MSTPTLTPAPAVARERDVFDALCEAATLTLRIGRHLINEANVAACGVQLDLVPDADAWQVGRDLGLYLSTDTDPLTGEPRRVANGPHPTLGYVEVFSTARTGDRLPGGLVVA